jgi:hypothetical protein
MLLDAQVRHDREVRMADKKDLPGGAGAPEARMKRPTADASFDRWLVGQMRKLYDEVLEESVPDDLVQLVRSFDAAEATASHEAEAQQSGDHGEGGNAQPRS